jgi:hypothetical protein
MYTYTFKPKIPKILRALEWKMLVCIFYDLMEYFTAIWYNLRQFGIVCGHLVIIFPVLVCLNQQKSGNPDTYTYMYTYKVCLYEARIFCRLTKILYCTRSGTYMSIQIERVLHTCVEWHKFCNTTQILGFMYVNTPTEIRVARWYIPTFEYQAVILEHFGRFWQNIAGSTIVITVLSSPQSMERFIFIGLDLRIAQCMESFIFVGLTCASLSAWKYLFSLDWPAHRSVHGKIYFHWTDLLIALAQPLRRFLGLDRRRWTGPKVGCT